MVRGRERHRRALAASAVLVGAAVALAVVFVRHSHGGRHGGSTVLQQTVRTRPAARERPRRPHVVAGPHDTPVPILMYHVIAVAPASARFPQLFVRPSAFAGQVRWLAAHGYHAVTLRRVYDYWRAGDALPRKPIVLSFDDGYLPDDTRARPLLAARRWPGVLNLEVDNLRSTGDLPPWRVRRLIAAGWEIDAHTITHPDLTTLDAARLRTEVAGSRAIIRRAFHLPVDFFCYPSGRYDAAVLAAVRHAGYLGATTTQYGLASPSALFTLRRIEVLGSDGVDGLARKLEDLARSQY
jgi:peptidoglycan/xylan/chitin deacetylase (PgdA/CDA1 family)